jgi:hypothetical protein
VRVLLDECCSQMLGSASSSATNIIDLSVSFAARCDKQSFEQSAHHDDGCEVSLHAHALELAHFYAQFVRQRRVIAFRSQVSTARDSLS